MHHKKCKKHLHVHRKKQAITFHLKMQRLNHIRKEKQRQACTDSQCGFCGRAAVSKPSNYSFAQHVF